MNHDDAYPKRLERLFKVQGGYGTPRASCEAATVSLVAHDDEKIIGVGSAFVMCVDRTLGDNASMVVVTARHNVQKVINLGGKHSLKVRRAWTSEDSPHVWPVVDVEIDKETWIHGDSDVSIARLPIEALPETHMLSFIDRSLMFDRVPLYLTGGADVSLFGRWSTADSDPIIIERRGILASRESPRVKIEIEPNCFTPTRVFLADATVASGMSGGPIVLSTGDGWAQNAVLGLIHGFFNEKRQLLDHYAHDDSVLTFAQQIAAINGRIVLIIPFDEILETIAKYQTSSGLT